MKQEDNYDEIDKLLFDAFEKSPDVPDSFSFMIKNAFNVPSRKQHKKVYNSLQKVAILILSFSILTTGIVFAKDIINFIANFFTNSTEAIDTAIENGYVQNVNMDFIFDNNIGAKVNYLVIDDSNLDISFVYYSENTNISNIEVKDFIIRDDNNNIICYELEDTSQIEFPKDLNFSCTRTSPRFKNENGMYNESILCTAPIIPNSKILIFEIKSFIITNTENKTKTINGNWIFSINIDNNIMKRITEQYTTSYNQYINKISTNLTETSLKIDLELNTKVDEIILSNIDSTILKNYLNEEFECVYKRSHIENNITYINLEFNISKYYENIDKLYLYLKYDIDKYIEINLYK